MQQRSGIRNLIPIIGRKAAEEFLRRHELKDLLSLDRKTLLRIRHVGPRRAEAILSLPKIFRQLASAPVEGRSVSCSGDVYRLFEARLGTLVKEHFLVLTLNTRNIILSEDLCAVGSVNTVHIHPSEVLRQAVIEMAPSILCLHNHPAGDPSPSPEDRNLTERIASASALMGIRFLDHIIVAAGAYYSFSDAGEL
ncbi:MAG: JAB domain-containing protein [bacterium]|nr:JAB domain-containing protein [bacterium]